MKPVSVVITSPGATRCLLSSCDTREPGARFRAAASLMSAAILTTGTPVASALFDDAILSVRRVSTTLFLLGKFYWYIRSGVEFANLKNKNDANLI